MADFKEPVGQGGIWIKESKNGKKFLSWSIEFAGPGGPPLKVQGVAFKNEKKEGNQPSYKILVNSCDPAPAKEYKFNQILSRAKEG